ncbi:MAG: cyclic nucleotide-binding domain-containing protein [Planctomycetota bacterium]|nr:cyclic nucleotide-binding domain-containing protein [Planctomycetota bacterium]
MEGKLNLTIMDTGKCECCRAGDRVVLDYPYVLKRESNRVCLHFICGVRQACEAVLADDLEPVTDKMLDHNTFALHCEHKDCRLLVKVERYTSGDTRQFGPIDTMRLTMELNKLEFFSGMSGEMVNAFAENSQIVTFDSGEVLMQKGEAGKHLYIVLRGTAEVRGSRDGEEHSLAVLKRADSIGEMSVLTGEPVSATVVARNKCTVARISRSSFMELLREFPTLTLCFSRILARRIRFTNERIYSMIEQGITGNLSAVSLPELIQVINVNGRTGTLKITGEKGNATLKFGSGILYNASCGSLTGEDAFFEVVTWRKGDFQFEAEKLQSERVIKSEVMGLLLEATRRLDENSR